MFYARRRLVLIAWPWRPCADAGDISENLMRASRLSALSRGWQWPQWFRLLDRAAINQRHLANDGDGASSEG